MPAPLRSNNPVPTIGIPNSLLGGILFLSALTTFTLYTIWAIVIPFLPSDSDIHHLFPDRKWAIRLPAFVLVVGLGLVGIFIGVTLRSDIQQQLVTLKSKQDKDAPPIDRSIPTR